MASDVTSPQMGGVEHVGQLLCTAQRSDENGGFPPRRGDYISEDARTLTARLDCDGRRTVSGARHRGSNRHSGVEVLRLSVHLWTSVDEPRCADEHKHDTTLRCLRDTVRYQS